MTLTEKESAAVEKLANFLRANGKLNGENKHSDGTIFSIINNVLSCDFS